MSSSEESLKPWNQIDFGLDNRLIKALLKQGFATPTLIQSRSIPIALQGKDLMIRSRTVSLVTIIKRFCNTF